MHANGRRVRSKAAAKECMRELTLTLHQKKNPKIIMLHASLFSDVVKGSSSAFTEPLY